MSVRFNLWSRHERWRTNCGSTTTRSQVGGLASLHDSKAASWLGNEARFPTGPDALLETRSRERQTSCGRPQHGPTLDWYCRERRRRILRGALTTSAVPFQLPSLAERLRATP